MEILCPICNITISIDPNVTLIDSNYTTVVTCDHCGARSEVTISPLGIFVDLLDN